MKEKVHTFFSRLFSFSGVWRDPIRDELPTDSSEAFIQHRQGGKSQI